MNLINNILVLHRIVAPKESKCFEDVGINLLKEIIDSGIQIGGTLDSLSECAMGNSVYLTFDDGNISDYEVVMPFLMDRSVSASFFIVSDWVDRPGYLTKSQIQEMHRNGMQIGSHSKSHLRMSLLSEDKRKFELIDSKNHLEDILGIPISCFAFPYGDETEAIYDQVLDCGYKYFCTSRHGLYRAGMTSMPRNSINRTFDSKSLARALRPNLMQKSIWVAEDVIKPIVKRIAPNLYDSIKKIKKYD